nr:hypothetical protein [Tanacetum cinerariifolium]
MVSATKDPLTFNDLMATPIDFSNIKLEYNFKDCFNALTYKLDWNNPEGDRYLFDLSKPLPLQGYPCHLTAVTDYFFNNDLEYLKSSNPKRTYTTSITKTNQLGMRLFLDGTLEKVWDELHHRVVDIHLGYNTEMSRRMWTAIDKWRLKLMVELIEKKMCKRMIIQNLKRLVGAWELEMDYKLMTCTI